MQSNSTHPTKTEKSADLLLLAEREARFYKALSNARRLLILWLLADQECSVHEIAEATGTSLQNTSQHLHLMQETGLVWARREAQTVYYRVVENERLRNCLCIFRSIQKQEVSETLPHYYPEINKKEK